MPPPAPSMAPGAASPSGAIKGVAFRQFVLWYEEQVGPERFAELVAALPQRVRETLDPSVRGLGILSATWYPAADVFPLLDGIAAQIPASKRERLTTEGARAVMDGTLRGVYRSLFRLMASPERYAKYGPKLWGTYYDSGTFEIDPEPGGRGAVCTIAGWETHHPLVCDLNRGASIAIYEAMGCQGVTCVRESCAGRGGAACRFVTRWTGVR